MSYKDLTNCHPYYNRKCEKNHFKKLEKSNCDDERGNQLSKLKFRPGKFAKSSLNLT